jgi:hypothetical protein
MADDTAVSEAVAKAKLSCKPGARKNIVWRTLLPHWGHNAAGCVKDRVFVLCDEGWKSDAPLLVCLDVKDGRILWQKPVDHMDAWPSDKAKVGRECRAKEIKRWRDHMTWWNRFYWDNEKNAAAAATRREADWNRLVEEAKKDGWLFPSFANRSLRYWPCDAGNGTVRGRFGLHYSGGKEGIAAGGAPAGPELVKNFERCVREHYYIYPGWTSEGPFYGSTMGSVVSDGEFVYAVTAQEGAACYDFNGNQRWAADLASGVIGGPSAGMRIGSHHAMASPVLADDKLVYYHRDAVAMYGLDKATGRVVWKTEAPKIRDADGPKWLKGHRVVGYRGHMAPGGTPVVMRLPKAKASGEPTTVVVSGHGMVVRVSDGKMLGMVRMPLPEGAKKEVDETDTDADAGADEGEVSNTYNSWTAWKEVLYCQHMEGWVYAIRLAVEGDALKQGILWRSVEDGDNRDPNLVYHDGRLHCGPFSKGGWAALDTATGKVLATGPRPQGYSTSLGVGDGKIVMRSSGWKGNGARYTTYTILNQADLKPIGTGLLVQPKPEGEVAARHIGFLGTPYIAWGVGGITCWGNRIFIRSNDYLWCIGNPEELWQRPEESMAP